MMGSNCTLGSFSHIRQTSFSFQIFLPRNCITCAVNKETENAFKNQTDHREKRQPLTSQMAQISGIIGAGELSGGGEKERERTEAAGGGGAESREGMGQLAGAGRGGGKRRRGEGERAGEGEKERGKGRGREEGRGKG